MDLGDSEPEGTIVRGRRGMHSHAAFLCLRWISELSSELLFNSYTKLMASPGISAAHSNLLSFSVNSHSVKAVYHYLHFSPTQSN